MKAIIFYIILGLFTAMDGIPKGRIESGTDKLYQVGKKDTAEAAECKISAMTWINYIRKEKKTEIS